PVAWNLMFGGYRSADWASTDAETSGAPTPGVNGVAIMRQSDSPATDGKMLPNVRRASTMLAPSGARPGVPWGTSGGWKHTCIVAAAKAAAGSLLARASTKTGTSCVTPEAFSTRTQKALCVSEPVHAVAACASGNAAPPERNVSLRS